eukprot:147926_1
MTTEQQAESYIGINETKTGPQESKEQEGETSDYWLYLNSGFKGPYNAMQLIQMYKSNQIRHLTQAKVQLATNPSTELWYTFELSKSADNTEIAKHLPRLYQHFVKPIVNGGIKSYMPPDPPSNSKSSFQQFASVFTTFIDVVYCMHLVVSLPLVLMFYLVMVCKYGGRQNVWKVMTGQTEDWFPTPFRISKIFGLLANLGIMTTPLCVALVYFKNYGVYSPMIAYLAWGISSFLVSATADLLDIYWADGSKEYKHRGLISKYVFLMANIDVGSVDVFKLQSKYFKRGEMKRNASTFYGVFYVMPAMICLIVGATVGFGANYILEVKFLLKCGGGIVNDDLCFESGYGCCNVISSHDFKSSGFWTFLSSMGGSIVSVFVVVKIMVLVYAQGHRVLYSMTAKSSSN